MKKKFIVMLVFLLAISMLMVGCGDKNTEETTTVNQEATTDVSNEPTSNEEVKEEVITEEPSVEEEQKEQEKETENGTTTNTTTSVGYSDGNTSVSESVGTSGGVSQGISSGVFTSGGSGVSEGTNTAKQEVSPKKEKPETEKVDGEQPKSEEPKKEEPKKEEPKKEEPKTDQTPAQEEKKPGLDLTALSTEELKRLLDEIYPGDNLTQKWIDKLPAEKLYEYFGGSYIRTSEKVIDASTVECTVTVRTEDGTKTHKVRLKVDNDGFWSVVSDEIVQ